MTLTTKDRIANYKLHSKKFIKTKTFLKILIKAF